MSRPLPVRRVPTSVQHQLDCIVDAQPGYGVCGCVPGFDSTVGDNGVRLFERTHHDHVPSDTFIRDEADRLSGYYISKDDNLFAEEEDA